MCARKQKQSYVCLGFCDISINENLQALWYLPIEHVLKPYSYTTQSACQMSASKVVIM